MALQQRPYGYAEAREELISYCHENNITSSILEYPFDWPEFIDRPDSPDLDFTDIFPASNFNFEESFDWNEDDQTYLDNILSQEKQVDIYDTRETKQFRLELPLLHHRSGPETLRKFGPDSLKKCAAPIQTISLQGNEGLDIPLDNTEVVRAFERDSKLTANRETVEYLKDVILRYTNNKGVDIILPTPLRKEIILSPPLIPYSPPRAEYVVPGDEIHPPSLPAPKFNDEISFSSPFEWDDLSDPSSTYLNELASLEKTQSPPKVVDTETNFLSKLKLEVPLTPVSLKKPRPASDLEPPRNLKDLGKSVLLVSPQSSSFSPGVKLENLERELFNEIYTAESSLRLPLPQLPPYAPKKVTFPTSMFGVFIADEGLGCELIARSILDTLNDEMKWNPFITKKMRTLDAWPEEVEGDWEDFVDYRGPGYDSEISVLHRAARSMEEEEILEPWNFSASETRRENSDDDLMDVLEAVRKRKAEHHEISLNGHDIGKDLKRSKWSQKDRVAEYMTVRGREISDFRDEEIPGKLMILGDDSPSVPMAVPLQVLSDREKVFAPTLQLNASHAVKAIIVSSTSLHRHCLLTFLHRILSETIFFERDLTTSYADSEGDIILSPNRCIIFFTLAQITQTLPSTASNRILAVASKYRHVEVLVTCTAEVKGKQIASFSGWLERVRQEYNVRLIYAIGDEELSRWVSWFCLWREIDAESFEIDHLSEEEMEGEEFLRNAFNVYSSQIILGRTSLEKFVCMSHEIRMKYFHDIASERHLLRFDALMSESAV